MKFRDLDFLKGKSLSNGYSYLEYDQKNDKLSLIASRIENKPFYDTSHEKYHRFKETSTVKRDNFGKFVKSQGEDPVPFQDPYEPVCFTKLNPNDVYGSYIMSKERLNSIDAEETPAAKEFINHNKRHDEDFDEFDSSEGKLDDNDKEGDTKDGYNVGVYEFTHPLKEVSLKEEGCTEASYTDLFISKKEVKNIEVIRLRAYFGYYHRLRNLYEDVMHLLKYTLGVRCKNTLAKFYITEIIYKVHSLFADKKRRAEYKRLYKEDFDYKFEINVLLKVHGKWSKSPGPMRSFIPVDDYVPVTESEDILSRLNTTKTSK